MTEDARQLAVTMLQHTREDLAKADTKANILFAVVGIVAGGLFASALSDKWTPVELTFPAEAVAWLAILALLAALVLLGLAIFPRIKVRSPRRLTFFGQVRTIATVAELEDELEREASRTENRDAEQLLTLSKIAWIKYRLIQAALISAAIALGFGVCAGIVVVVVAI